MSDSKRSEPTDKKDETKNEDDALDQTLPHEIHSFFHTGPYKNLTKSYLIPPEITQKFLLHVVNDEDDVEEMLKETPLLAFEKGDVTDSSGRQFINISGFQYALWALNVNMWMKMQPTNENFLEIANEQLKEVKHPGVSYIPPDPVTDKAKEQIKKINEEERKKIKGMLATEKKDDPFFDNSNLVGIALSYHNHTPDIKTESHYDFKLVKSIQDFNKFELESQKRVNNNGSINQEKAKEFREEVIDSQRLVPENIFAMMISNGMSIGPKVEGLLNNLCIIGHKEVEKLEEQLDMLIKKRAQPR